MKPDLTELPVEVLDGDIAILGRKGGGKTFSAKGIVERLLDMKRRVLILDPLGVWAGLRTSADGKSPGYPVAIFGGEHADMPLDPAAAAALAEVIARENMPAVIDLSELSKSQQGLFLYRFLGELRKVNREALTIVLEEADVFAPQNPMGDDSKALHGEIDWIARRGRYRGFRLITITQRPARLSKDVLTQCSTLIAHRLPAPQDRDAIKAWVDGNGDRDQAKEVFDTLAGLKVGEAWVWSPEHDLLQRLKFPRIKTLDTSSTPKAGEARVDAKTLAQVDLSGIKAALAEAAAAEKKTKGKSVGEAVQPDQAALKEAYADGYSAGERDANVAHRFTLGEFKRRFREVYDDLFSGFDGPFENGAAPSEAPIVPGHYLDTSTGRRVIAEPTPDKIEWKGAPLTIAPPSAPARQDRPKFANDPREMPTVAAKIVDAIDMKPARPFTWTQIAMLAGYSESGGQFRRGKKWLIETGAVVEGNGRAWIAKPNGKAAAPEGAALIDFWAAKLPSVGGVILRNMWNFRSVGMQSIGRIATETNYAPSGGQFRRGLKSLRDASIAATDGNKISFTAEFRELAGLS